MASTSSTTDPDRVQHHYHDHSNEGDDRQTYFPVNMVGQGNSLEQSFPLRLHYVLAELEMDGFSHIASWQPHGRCFVVHNREEFVAKVLPRWFNQHSYSSFQRQLNIYSYKRLTTGPDKGGYYHELFLRGMDFLSHRITRNRIKNNGRRKPASPENEPDFYKMTPLPPRNSVIIGQDGDLSSATLSSLLARGGKVPFWRLTNPGTIQADPLGFPAGYPEIGAFTPTTGFAQELEGFFPAGWISDQAQEAQLSASS